MSRSDKNWSNLSLGMIGFGAFIPSFHVVYLVLGMINEYTPIPEYINITVTMVFLISLIICFVMIYGCWSYRYRPKLFQRVFQVGILLIITYIFLSCYIYSSFPDEPGMDRFFYMFYFISMVAGVFGSIMISSGARDLFHFANHHEMEEEETSGS